MGITPPDYPGELSTEQLGPPAQVPNSIVTAALLMWLSTLVYVVVHIIAFVQVARDKDGMSDWFADGSSYTDADLNQVYATTLIGIVLTGLVGALLWAGVAWAVGRGHRWARGVATALGVINVSLLVWATAYGVPGVFGVLTWFTIVAGPLTLALLWNKESSAYYRATRAHGPLPGPGMQAPTTRATVKAEPDNDRGDIA